MKAELRLFVSPCADWDSTRDLIPVASCFNILSAKDNKSVEDDQISPYLEHARLSTGKCVTMTTPLGEHLATTSDLLIRLTG
jgi:hypothetical protein